MRIETLAVHAGRGADPATSAVDVPIHLSTTFERSSDGSFPHGFIYARADNPTRASLERCLVALESGVQAVAFASGSAAMSGIFSALSPGAHIVASEGYYGTSKLLSEVFERWGLVATFLDTGDLDAVRKAIRQETKLLWIETPSNPLVRVSDIEALAALAREAGARLAVDNTVGTPCLQRPLDLGADFSVHSTTKYLGGHGDVVGGAVVARANDGFLARVRAAQTVAGWIPSPFDCWLVLRGIKTLPCRVRAQSESALKVATFLEESGRLEAVHYPGLPSNPGHRVASRQMSLFGGLMAIQVRGGRDEAMALAARVRLFTRATSLGGTESLIEHRASVESPTTTPENLLRLSIGLEHPDDLIEDLRQALK